MSGSTSSVTSADVARALHQDYLPRQFASLWRTKVGDDGMVSEGGARKFRDGDMGTVPARFGVGMSSVLASLAVWRGVGGSVSRS